MFCNSELISSIIVFFSYKDSHLSWGLEYASSRPVSGVEYHRNVGVGHVEWSGLGPLLELLQGGNGIEKVVGNQSEVSCSWVKLPFVHGIV